MTVQQLSQTELRARLCHQGLRIRTGALVTRIRTSIPRVQRGIAVHYANHPVEPDEAFADFHVSVHKRSPWARQVVFRLDGEMPFNALPGDQGFPLLEWGLNWCVTAYCHQYLIVHCAVVERNGCALLLPAPSGSGKSTLAAGLVYSGGWRLLSDEMALIEPATGLVWPLPRPVSLKNASIDVVRSIAPSARFGEEVLQTVKGRVTHVAPPIETVTRAHEPARPTWVVVPRYESGAPPRFEPLTRGRGFMQLVDNSFNYDVLGRSGFDALARVIDGCSCSNFVYGDLAEAIREFDNLARGPSFHEP